MLEDFLTRITRYHKARDYPAVRGPSYLSAHLRFGTISIRRLVAEAHKRRSGGAETWLSELIWREFYFQILHHQPHVVHHGVHPQRRRVVPRQPVVLLVHRLGRAGCRPRDLRTADGRHRHLRDPNFNIRCATRRI